MFTIGASLKKQRKIIINHITMKHKINLFILAVLAIFYFIPMGSLQSQELNRIEPPFWWAGMKNTELQLMVNGKDIGKTRVSINYPGIQLKETVLVENPNYLFLNLVLSPEVQPGTFQIVFETGKKSL
jgi:neopullulanase